MKISPTGAWQCETKEPHGFDEPLAHAILHFLELNRVNSVIDLGCGSGAYVDFLNSYGIGCKGYDGNPATPNFSKSCHVADLTIPLDLGDADCVLSLEVGEHIPEPYERVFIDNVALHANRFVILSWFPMKGEGIGHVNERGNDYVKGKMRERLWLSMDDEEKKLREASTLWWFGCSLMVFQRE